jgi:protein-L-isoaspartate(D-aspartate) O-methyltransferase
MEDMSDTIDYGAARQAMVLGQLRPEGVTDPLVLAAMASVQREQFVPSALRPIAYMDRSLLIDAGAPMMAPAELGRLLDGLAARPGESALVVGPGGAYAAAVLEKIGCMVDRCDGAEGGARKRYDLILVEGAIEVFPESLEARLAPGGRVGAAIVDRGVARLSIGRSSRHGLGFKSIADAGVPPLAGFARPRPEFVF